MLPSRPLFAAIASGASVTAAIVIGGLAALAAFGTPFDAAEPARAQVSKAITLADVPRPPAPTPQAAPARPKQRADRPSSVRATSDRPAPRSRKPRPQRATQAFRAKASEPPADRLRAGRASPRGPRGQRAARREPGPGREHPRAHQGPPAWTPRVTRPRALQPTILGHVASGRRSRARTPSRSRPASSPVAPPPPPAEPPANGPPAERGHDNGRPEHAQGHGADRGRGRHR